jgi:excinuclease ABC subunit C
MENPALAFRPDPGTIPAEPGCYLWRDRRGRVVYVGKAKSLRSRLASYFGDPTQLHERTRAMLEVACDIEWIVTESEVEALHLEYNLIKQHRPRYNVRYTDDKSYPYLAITVGEEIPRAMVRRNPKRDGTRYFGPFAHAYAIRETLDLLLRVFPVRTCSPGVYERCERTGRPCLLHHIGRCSAPCVGAVSAAEHRELVDRLIRFLEGSTEPVLNDLRARMEAESERLNFESAARIRDQLQAAETALAKQQMATDRPEDFDAVHFHADELEVAFQAFYVRGGRVVGRKGWTADRVEAMDTPELLERFLQQLGAERAEDLPREILVPEPPRDPELLKQALTDMRREASGRTGRVRIRVPQRGAKREFLERVRENAVEAFGQHRLKRAKDFNARSQSLRELQEALELAEAPLRIECYDISQLQGRDAVGSMVVLEDALPRKSDYRRFKIKGVVGQDDYAMVHEVLTRRLRRLHSARGEAAAGPDGGAGGSGGGKFDQPPDLILIDGGKGQLGAARRAMAEVGVEDVPVAALAKRLEEVFLPDREDPVVLPRGSEALFLLQRIRDEAHRFAVRYHRTLRGKRMTASAFDDVPGVGPARRKALLEHFGTLDRVRAASEEELAEVEGISTSLARTIVAHLQGEPG